MTVLSKKDGLDLKRLVCSRQIDMQMSFYPKIDILQNLRSHLLALEVNGFLVVMTTMM